jgi:hypothetical protein
MTLLEGPVSWWSVSEVFCRLQATVPTPQAHKEQQLGFAVALVRMGRRSSPLPSPADRSGSPVAAEFRWAALGRQLQDRAAVNDH